MKKEDPAKLPKVEWFPIGKISPHPGNPRAITQKDFDSLVKSIEEDPGLFHARPLLLSDRTGELIIIGGDKRFRAAKKLGWKTVPGIILSGLNELDEKRILIKDNGKWGEWDWDMLANNWVGLPLSDWGTPIPEDWSSVDVLESGKNIGNNNYGDLSSHSNCPMNILGIGGNVPYETMEIIKKKLMDHGAKEDIDNTEILTEMFTFISKKWGKSP
jgi:hypothetical protein